MAYAFDDNLAFLKLFFVEFEISQRTGLLGVYINEKVFIIHWIFYFFFGGLLVYYWKQVTNWVQRNRTFSLIST